MKNKRICLQEGWLGTETAAVMIDKTLMEETGAYFFLFVHTYIYLDEVIYEFDCVS